MLNPSLPEFFEFVWLPTFDASARDLLDWAEMSVEEVRASEAERG